MAWNNRKYNKINIKDILVISVDQSVKFDIYLPALRMSVHEHATFKSLDGLGITMLLLLPLKYPVGTN